MVPEVLVLVASDLDVKGLRLEAGHDVLLGDLADAVHQQEDSGEWVMHGRTSLSLLPAPTSTC